VSAIVHLLRGHAQATGIVRVHPYALRHTCATHLLRRADIRNVQAILGHRWIKTTVLYTRVNIEDLAAVGRCHPREGNRRWRR
jgi:site-specific recombinase XerD